MKLFELFKNISDSIFSIQENCNGKFIEYHTAFGFGENDESDLLFLWGSGNNDTQVVLADQDVTLTMGNLDTISVVDTNKNAIQLTFFKATVISICDLIDHPLTIGCNCMLCESARAAKS